MATAKFLGFQQLSAESYQELVDGGKLGNYLYLVRDKEKQVYDIYLNEKHYAHYVSGYPIEDIEKILEGFSTDYTVQSALTELRQYIGEISGDTAVTADTVVEYVQKKIEALPKMWYFKGTAKEISEDNKTVTLDDGTTIEAADENAGWVYQIDGKEYASNGEIWVELGDTSDYYTKEEIDEKETALKEADTKIQQKLDAHITEEDMVHTITGDDVSDGEEETNEAKASRLIDFISENGGTAVVDENTEVNVGF